MEVFLLIGLAVLIGLNVHATRQCYKDSISSRGQRFAQIAFVWAVPVVGAILALRLLNNEIEPSSGKYKDPSKAGDEFVTGYGRQNSQGYISSPNDNFHAEGGSDASPD